MDYYFSTVTPFLRNNLPIGLVATVKVENSGNEAQHASANIALDSRKRRPWRGKGKQLCLFQTTFIALTRCLNDRPHRQREYELREEDHAADDADVGADAANRRFLVPVAAAAAAAATRRSGNGSWGSRVGVFSSRVFLKLDLDLV
jgi:hypothetical protein